MRTNADREAGEEDVPDWVFEQGVVSKVRTYPRDMQMRLAR
ncbi:MAG: hypothetical protein R3F54_10070 [Alphaproteobacteria bacterium]